MKKIATLLFVLCLVVLGYAKTPKYVFYFIGDGMGPSHVLGTELFLGEKQGVIGRPQPLCFTQFPQTSFVTTFSASNGVTDSAASGTALSTGNKTKNGSLGVDVSGAPLYSVALAAKESGYAVGISTTVCINHATPGAFYAHQPSRNNYYDIAKEMVSSGYDFFAGGDPNCNSSQHKSVMDEARKEGYSIARGFEDYKKKADEADKIMLYQKDVAVELPYAIDRKPEDLTLAQITEAGIDFLQKKSNKGFFLMVEGGKIDYASHSDDVSTMFHEVIDFDNAVRVAYEFYKKHKDETLIIVTADHETGGVVLGFNSAYTLNLKALSGQKASVDKIKEMLIAADEKKPLTWENVCSLLNEQMGLWDTAAVNEEQVANLRHIFEQAESAGNKDKRASYLKRLVEKAKGCLAHNAAVSWASGNHSGTYVPLFAVGVGAEDFHGVIDNTDIPKMIKRIAHY